jgi:outer membrane protein TolC
MTDLEKAKVAFADASIRLEIAQGQYNEAKGKLVAEMNKPQPKEEPKAE